MLKNTDGTKFKYADDSQILVSAETQASFCEKIQKNLNSVKNMVQTHGEFKWTDWKPR